MNSLALVFINVTKEEREMVRNKIVQKNSRTFICCGVLSVYWLFFSWNYRNRTHKMLSLTTYCFLLWTQCTVSIQWDTMSVFDKMIWNDMLCDIWQHTVSFFYSIYFGLIIFFRVMKKFLTTENRPTKSHALALELNSHGFVTLQT